MPLHCAAQAGNVELVALFIVAVAGAEGSCIDLAELLRWRNQHGETAFYQAVHHSRAAVIKEMMRADQDNIDNQRKPPLASIPNKKSISPLCLAIMHRSADIATSLIESLCGNELPEAHAGPDGQTALLSEV